MTGHPTPVRRYRCQDFAGGAMVLVDQAPPPGAEGGPIFTVTRWDSGGWTCSCAESRFSGGCRHLAAVRRMGLFGGAGGAATGA